MAKTRLFIGFDYDHDLDIKTMLAGQANSVKCVDAKDDYDARRLNQ